jgi:hypothetical protein
MKVNTTQEATDTPQARTLTIYILVFVSFPPELLQTFIVAIGAHNEKTNQDEENEAEEAHTDSKPNIICNSGKTNHASTRITTREMNKQRL